MTTKYGQSDAQLGYNQPVHSTADVEEAGVKPLVKQSRLGKFELFKNAGDEWQFRLKAGNGEVIAVSESYSSKDGALNGIKSVQNNAKTTKIVEV